MTDGIALIRQQQMEQALKRTQESRLAMALPNSVGMLVSRSNRDGTLYISTPNGGTANVKNYLDSGAPTGSVLQNVVILGQGQSYATNR